MWIRNPAEWGVSQITSTGHALRSLGHALVHTEIDTPSAPIDVRRIAFADLGDALVKGFDDFAVFRDDVLFIGLIYPAVGFALAEILSNTGLLPLIFPLFSGFALVGPFAAVWLYDMSRRRERGENTSWAQGFRAFASPSAASIFKLGLVLLGLFVLWLGAAAIVYRQTVGAEAPQTMGAFIGDIFTTPAGWSLIAVGLSVGFLFALVALSISVISFPLLLDRRVPVATAMATSIRAVRVNPGPMLAWGLIVAASVVAGMIPVLIGLIVVLPVLGHATWHLYRKVVV